MNLCFDGLQVALAGALEGLLAGCQLPTPTHLTLEKTDRQTGLVLNRAILTIVTSVAVEPAAACFHMKQLIGLLGK